MSTGGARARGCGARGPELWGSPMKVERGAGGERGHRTGLVLGTAKTAFPTTAHYKWAQGWKPTHPHPRQNSPLASHSVTKCPVQFPPCALY